jgi:NitT/TauT family transport system substrate-binding protein
MKRSISLSLLLAFLLLSGCQIWSAEQVEEATPVRLLLPFRPDIQFAPFYVAQEKGYFQQEGLEVTFEHMPENEAVSLVGAGEVPFAIVSGEQVLLARAQGLPVVYVMAWWQDYPVAVAAPMESDIHRPEDLIGKKIGIPGTFGASYIGYRALLGAANIAEEQITLDSIGYSQVEAMLAGQEDAVVVYANNEPVQLESQGMPMRVIRVADYVHLASNGLITSEKIIADNPELITRMIRAIQGAIAEAMQKPGEAYEISGKYVEGLEEANQEVIYQVLLGSIEFWKSEKTGYSSPEAWENMHAVLLKMGLLEEPLLVDEAYRNDFLADQ